MVPDSPPQASGAHLPAEEQGGTWPTQNQSSQDDQENQQRSHALQLHPEVAKTNLCRRQRGLGPQDQESLSGCTLESVQGSFKQHPPQQVKSCQTP